MILGGFKCKLIPYFLLMHVSVDLIIYYLRYKAEHVITVSLLTNISEALEI